MKIKNIVGKTKYFSIIADEVTDRYSNKEILLFCLSFLKINRKIGVPVIEEIFLDSNYVLGSPTWKVIGNHIMKLLADHGFKVNTSDGAAVMSSQTKGASSVIKKRAATCRLASLHKSLHKFSNSICLQKYKCY